MRACFGLLSLTILVMTGFVNGVFAQEIFEDPEGKYRLTLPAGWIAVVSQDTLGKQDVNIVYRNRETGALKLRRADEIDTKMEVIDFAKKDELESVRFALEYNKISIENFVVGGGKTGALLSYDFKNPAGQPFTGRNYYLRGDEKTIYILRFTGRKNTLGTLRNQTDAIARSFLAK
ncbi:MAG: hypothetical protein L0220_16940 [Acidobacteria bacterium]|nr:hypothetical protein [Acidobacteriota bacterium]